MVWMARSGLSPQLRIYQLQDLSSVYVWGRVGFKLAFFLQRPIETQNSMRLGFHICSQLDQSILVGARFCFLTVFGGVGKPDRNCSLETQWAWRSTFQKVLSNASNPWIPWTETDSTGLHAHLPFGLWHGCMCKFYCASLWSVPVWFWQAHRWSIGDRLWAVQSLVQGQSSYYCHRQLFKANFWDARVPCASMMKLCWIFFSWSIWIWYVSILYTLRLKALYV